MTNRRVMTIEEIREISIAYLMEEDDNLGICALVDVENMGWCKDCTTRWYTFTDDEGNPTIYFKH